jgi:hypothetical protein
MNCSPHDAGWALSISPHDAQARQQLRLYLVSCSDEEVSRHFTETFACLQARQDEGYSEEALLHWRWSLLEILVELRVRGLEADYAGHVYHAPVFLLAPTAFALARKRQLERLKRLPASLQLHVCGKTLASAGQAAARVSKSA